jgi:carbonic anhydrase
MNRRHALRALTGLVLCKTLTFGGGPYRLLQFHFHHPSEHLIGGKSFPMEAHLSMLMLRARSQCSVR